MTPARQVGAASALIFLLALPLPSTNAQGQGNRSSCIDCHSGLGAAMSEPVSQWKESIHARNGISCASCHGGDPSEPGMNAMAPEKGFRGAPGGEEVPGFCARCHPGVAEDYRESAHGRALGGGGPQCVTCHGAHAVREATPEIINPDRCTACHDYGRAEEIKSALIRTDSRITRLHDRIRGFHLVGFDTKVLESRLFQVRNEFHRLFHTVDVERIRSRTAAFEEPLSELDARLANLERIQAGRRRTGAAVVGLLLLLMGLLALLRRSYRREERDSGR